MPLLTPMSEIAGRMSIQEGAKCLERPMQGQGILLGGVPGVAPANVLVLGGGVVGTNAARMAAGLAANVTIMDIHLDRLRYLDEVMPANVTTIFSDPHTIADYAMQADLVVGAVLIPGGRAPVLMSRSLVKTMKPGSVLVDVSIDQGGCAETSRPTTHSHPTYLVDGVVHYCVTNIPGAVSRTSTVALCNATLALRPPTRLARHRRLRRPRPRPRRRHQHGRPQAHQRRRCRGLPRPAREQAIVTEISPRTGGSGKRSLPMADTQCNQRVEGSRINKASSQSSGVEKDRVPAFVRPPTETEPPVLGSSQWAVTLLAASLLMWMEKEALSAR